MLKLSVHAVAARLDQAVVHQGAVLWAVGGMGAAACQDEVADRLLLAIKCEMASRFQAPSGGWGNVLQSVVQCLPHPVSVAFFIHSFIPFADRAVASVWVAREQWVLTLPSEQPIAAAVSATSMSSQ